MLVSEFQYRECWEGAKWQPLPVSKMQQRLLEISPHGMEIKLVTDKGDGDMMRIVMIESQYYTLDPNSCHSIPSMYGSKPMAISDVLRMATNFFAGGNALCDCGLLVSGQHHLKNISRQRLLASMKELQIMLDLPIGYHNLTYQGIGDESIKEWFTVAVTDCMSYRVFFQSEVVARNATYEGLFNILESSF